MKNNGIYRISFDVIIGLSLFVLVLYSLKEDSGTFAQGLLKLIPVVVGWWSVVYARQFLRISLYILTLHVLLVPVSESLPPLELPASIALCLIEMAAIQYALLLDQRSQCVNPTLDPLTGFALPSVFEAELALIASMSERQTSTFTLLGCEIDGFQEYANQFGDVAGDRLVRLVALSIGDCVRLSDTIGRWDSVQFLVILAGTRAGDAGHVVEKMRRRIAKIEAIDKGPVSLKFAIAEHHAGDDPLSVVERIEKQLGDSTLLQVKTI